jgi:hypothetical protein
MPRIASLLSLIIFLAEAAVALAVIGAVVAVAGGATVADIAADPSILVTTWKTALSSGV